MLRGANVKKLLFLFALFVLACRPAAGQSQQAIRVRCGGNNYTDSKGQVWQADYGYNGGWAGTPVATTIGGTTDQSLYQTGRYAAQQSASTMTYTFPVASGSYHVNLYFAETYKPVQKVGGRVFNVKMQGVTMFQNLDIYAAAGANASLVKGADVVATGGNITIEFDSITQVAKVDAIEITQSATAPQLNLTFVYPDGSPVVGTLNYQIAPAAGGTSLAGTQPLNSGQVTCLLLTSPQLLGLAGTLNVNLSLVDTTGRTLWQLTVTMNPSSTNFTAVQSSTLQVVVQKS